MFFTLATLLGVNIYIFGGFYVWLAAREKSLIDAATGAFLLWAAQVVAIQMLLAAAGIAETRTVIGMHLVLSSAIWLRSIRRLGVVAASTARTAWTTARALPWFSRLFVLVIGVALVWSVWLPAVTPEFGWDANMYHIPIGVMRAQSDSLERLQAGWPYIEGYPETGELFIAWGVHLTGRQDLANVVQWPFWVFGMLALIGLGRKLGADLSSALAGSTIWTLAPVAILQAQTAYIDLILAGLFWLGCNFVYRSPVSRRSVLLSGIAAGLMIGTKASGIILAAVLGILLLIRILRSVQPGRLLGAITAAWVGFSLLNSYWYVANWVEKQNPIWPMAVAIGPVQLEGSFDLANYETRYTPTTLARMPAWLRPGAVWLEPDAAYAADAKLTGFGPLWVLLGLPSIAAWAFYERRGWPLILACAGALAMMSLSWHTRYALFLPGLGALAFARILPRCGKPVKAGAKGVLLVAAVASVVLALDLHKLNAVWAPTTYRSPVYSDWSLLGGAYRWLDANTLAPTALIYGDRVAFPAPLWGEDLRRNVQYVRVNSEDEWKQAVRDSGAEWAFVVADSPEDGFLAGASWSTLVVDDGRISSPKTLLTRVYRLSDPGVSK